MKLPYTKNTILILSSIENDILGSRLARKTNITWSHIQHILKLLGDMKLISRSKEGRLRPIKILKKLSDIQPIITSFLYKYKDCDELFTESALKNILFIGCGITLSKYLPFRSSASILFTKGYISKIKGKWEIELTPKGLEVYKIYEQIKHIFN